MGHVIKQEDQRGLLQLDAASLYKNIIKLGWPVMVGSALHMTFNLVDVFWVSRLGAVQVAIPALAGSLLWLFMSLTEAINIGTVSMISRFEGARQRQLMSHVVVHSFWLALLMAMLVGGAVFLWAEPLLRLFTDDVSLLPAAISFIRITAVGLIFTFAVFSITGALNGIGDTLSPMLVMMATNGFNILLDPLLIFGLPEIPWLSFGGWAGVGVLGAAWATLAANVVALAILLFILFRRKELAVTSLLAPFNLSIVKNILGIGLPACLQSAARSSTGTILFWLVMSGYGTAAAAAFGAGQRMIAFAFVFLSGLMVAATTLTGQTLGKGDRELARFTARRLVVLGLAIQVLVGLFYIAIAVPVSNLFLGDNAQALAAGISYVRIIGIGLALGASTVVVGGIFKGSGHTVPTFLAGFIANWLVKLPVAALGTLVFSWPIEGIWWAISMSVVVEYGILLFWLQRGTWLEREIKVDQAPAG